MSVTSSPPPAKPYQSSIPTDEKSPIQLASILLITSTIPLDQLALGIQLTIAIQQGGKARCKGQKLYQSTQQSCVGLGKGSTACKVYIDKGRSILRFFFLANRTCFVTFMHKSNSKVMHTRINASCICLKYKETAEKTRNAMIKSSHITNNTTSTLQAYTGQREETKSESMSS
ncbi:hypothetical protein OIU77_020277 [Salix suchowensis]|uniref:Uncharacterized protein n=1 Tax=Salix suchowensis TaxID=1278906 RepID=A0ABQ9CK03_9ROSI|nr:hypothetical protein OIU77_020277 [Salix suchowensis]